MAGRDVQVETLVAPAEEDVDGDEEVQIQEETETEVERLRHAVDPGQPTSKQIELHRRSHLPFRLWCKWCILGRGRGIQHRRGHGSLIPIVGVDYFFITKNGVRKREELGQPDDEDGNKAINEARVKGEIVKCLVVRCFATKVVLAHVVPYKGVGEDDTVAEMVVEDIAWLGHTRVIVKADGEPALQSLIRRVLEIAKVDCKDLEQLSKEDPAAYDSQSNGGTEVGVRMIRGLFRSIKLCLEERLNKFIPIDHPVVGWMLQHTCLLLNVMVRGTDGLTAWARVKGRTFGQQLVGFAEAVLYRYPAKGPGHTPSGNMGAIGGEGIFIGYNKNSNTFIVATESGIIGARSITRRSESERWQPEAVAKIRDLPGAARERPQRPRVGFSEGATETGPMAEATRPTAMRRLRINMSDLRTYDHYEETCQQCKHIRRYGKARKGGIHNDTCRSKLVEKMQGTEAGRARLAEDEQRITQAMAEHIEQADQQGTQEQRAAPAVATAPREFLERSQDGQCVGARPPSSARVRNEHAPEAAEAGRAERPEGREPHVDLEVDHGGQEDMAGWLPVPGGEAAPATPRGTPQQVHGDAAATEGDDQAMEEDTRGGGDIDMDFIGSLEVEGDLGRLEPSAEDYASQLLLCQLGSLGRCYRREARKTAKVFVSEIYSPPRITEMIRKSKARHLLPGFALDITVNDPADGRPWDFSLAHKRERARRLVMEQKPYMLIGSPMCTHFCTWQALNIVKSKDRESMERARIAAEVHIKFVTELYHMQMDNNRYFLHEHPMFATSWSLASMESVSGRPGVQRVRGDQCQFGAEIKIGVHAGDPIMKPSGFLTNSPAVARVLNVRCTGVGGQCSRPTGGAHRLCSGQHAANAAIYPKGLCRAVLRGVRDQLREDGQLKNGCFGVQVPDEDATVEKNMRGPAQGYSGQFRDDLTGQVLRDDLVREARAKELEYFHSKGVWLKVPKHIAKLRGGRPPISVRWVDVNKGDDMNLKYRSRLVARQIKALDTSGTNYFAPAPPLEALRTVLSLAMTKVGTHMPNWNPRSASRTQISIVDIKRAYFNAKVDPRDPPTFVQLPPEDPDSATMCAQTLRHMYGTRLAADGWQEEYSTFLVGIGFRQGDACPNAFYHAERQLVTSVHGDDFASSGPANALDWMENAIGDKYEYDAQPRLGPGPEDAKEGRVLNRVIRWCEEGGEHRIEYEADPRQVERLIAECGLEGANAVATPGVKPTFQKLEEDTNLPDHLTTAFRGAAARGNYLAADRLDAQFACKEVCRYMSQPTTHAWEALKRVCRFFNRTPRLVYEFRQQSVSHVDVYTDTDWAGCPKTRKSTSGGCVMLGGHAVKHWSSTQQSISLSSGEAEFAGVIRGAGQGLGYQALLRDLGVELPLRVWTDSSAAIGICSRQGLGKLRHLDTHTLWVQQAVRTKRVDLRKVDGEQNPADLLTKHSISRQRLEGLVALFSCKYLGGRATSAPQVRRGDTTRMTMANADKDLGAVDGVAAAQSAGGAAAAVETSPIMPHLVYSQEELDQLYPGLEAPEDECLIDLQDDRTDGVYQHGLAVAEKIKKETLAQGRRRRPVAEDGGDGQEEPDGKARQAARRGGKAGGTGDDDLNLVSYSSTQWPRRSEKSWYHHQCQCVPVRSPLTAATELPAELPVRRVMHCVFSCSTA